MAVIFRGCRELSRALSFRAALFAAVNVSSSKRKVRRLRYHQLPCQKPIARLPVGVREADKLVRDGVANDQSLLTV